MEETEARSLPLGSGLSWNPFPGEKSFGIYLEGIHLSPNKQMLSITDLPPHDWASARQ